MNAVTQIVTKMKDEGRTMAWLAREIGISIGHMNNILKGTKPLTDEKLKSINTALKTRFRNEQKEVA